MKTFSPYSFKKFAQQVNLKKINLLSILFYVLCICSFTLKAQTPTTYTYDLSNTPINCGGVLPETNAVPKVTTANCGSSSPAYINKYRLQSNYKPATNSPLITLKITFHVILDAAGNGPFALSQGGLSQLTSCANWMHNWQERYSVDARNASYTTGDPLCVTGPTAAFQDSKINYELTNIYYYYSNAMNTEQYGGNICSYIAANFGASRLDEGLPIIINNALYPCGVNCVGCQTSYNNKPIVHTRLNTDPWGLQAHLRHEIGHAFGLMHTFYDPLTCCDEINQFGYNCNSPYFLCDVFPQNNTMCASGTSPCNVCTEGGGNNSNNLMGGSGGNGWMSYLQMGRKRMNMHLESNNIRNYAKEMTSSIIGAWQITSNETWDFDIQMYEDIIVKSGFTLTIKCKVGMANNGRIIVERGAKLIIDGGEVYAWGSNWAGIQVWGNVNQPQKIIAGLAPNHGIVDVINQGTLRDAVVAISMSKFFDNGDVDWGGYFGGIVRCNNAKFINNWKAIAFYPYHNKNVFKNTIPNASYAYNTLFETNANLKDLSLLTPDAFITLWAVDGIRFLGNTYRNTLAANPSLGNRGNGINSYDASCVVDRYKTGCIYNSTSGQIVSCLVNNPSTFTNLQYGVHATNSSPFSGITVNDNDFVGCNRGIYMGGSRYNTITNNRINVGDGNTSITLIVNGVATTPYSPYGIYSEASGAYDISNNSIFTTQTAIYGQSMAEGIIINSSNSSDNTIYRNNMNMMIAATTVYGDNKGPIAGQGLKLKCNNYGQGAAGLNKTDIYMGYVNFDPAGSIDLSQGSPSQGANNFFSRIDFDFLDRYSTLLPSSNPVSSFNYYFNSVTGNKTQPLYYSPTLFVNLPNAGAYNPNMCPTSLFAATVGSGGTKTVAYAKQVVSANTASVATLNAKIDGGNTQNLLATINSSISNGNLKNIMEQKSPFLSDVALIAYFSKPNVSSGNLKDIHDKNKPVSPLVWQAILNRNLPNGIMNNLNQQQATTMPSAMQILYGQIGDLNKQKGFIVDEVVRTLLADTIIGIDEAAIIELMKADNRYASKCHLLSGYVAMGKYPEATTVLNEIRTEGGGVIDQFCRLQELLISLKQQTKSIFGITTNTAVANELQQMAACATRSCNDAYANAQALLQQVLNYKHYEYMSLPNTIPSSQRMGDIANEPSTASNANVFNLYPNPSSGNTNLYLSKNTSLVNAEVIIIDITGKVVLTQPLNKDNAIHVLPTQGFARGLYLVTILTEGKVIDKQKLIIE